MNIENIADKISEDVFHDFYRNSEGLLLITENELARCIHEGIKHLGAEIETLSERLEKIPTKLTDISESLKF
jgi:hypothetical protein